MNILFICLNYYFLGKKLYPLDVPLSSTSRWLINHQLDAGLPLKMGSNEIRVGPQSFWNLDFCSYIFYKIFFFIRFYNHYRAFNASTISCHLLLSSLSSSLDPGTQFCRSDLIVSIHLCQSRPLSLFLFIFFHHYFFFNIPVNH